MSALDVQIGATKKLDEAGGPPREIQVLAEKLARIHGRVTISMENRGHHLYMASPKGLEEDGSRELDKRHLAVNADKYLGLGVYRKAFGTYDRDLVALCMKTNTPYRVSELLNMQPLAKRGFKESVDSVSYCMRERRLVPDGKGNMIPEPPGDVIKITELYGDHFAKRYLLDRNYDLETLVEMFDTSFCTRELPEDAVAKRFYKKYPNHFRDTPQGGIIFYANIGGVQRGWQRRIIEKIEGRLHYILMPNSMQFECCAFFDDVKWNTAPSFIDQRNPELKFKPAKYWISPNCLRNELLFGVDAALAWNEVKQREGIRRLAILTEGPLDAGRYGPPGVAFAGKYLSRAQGQLLAKYFQSIVYCPDNDEAGRETCDKNIKTLVDSGIKRVILNKFPSGIKDAGDYNSAQEARLPIRSLLNGDFE